ncbi:hypothetical protein MJT46_001007 [Ovis ammon polii x Ovis aries]|nr:hypothetical protein MJT46_001007 [Ovis ammon polii x Ovis aries]
MQSITMAEGKTTKEPGSCCFLVQMKSGAVTSTWVDTSACMVAMVAQEGISAGSVDVGMDEMKSGAVTSTWVDTSARMVGMVAQEGISAGSMEVGMDESQLEVDVKFKTASNLISLSLCFTSVALVLVVMLVLVVPAVLMGTVLICCFTKCYVCVYLAGIVPTKLKQSCKFYASDKFAIRIQSLYQKPNKYSIRFCPDSKFPSGSKSFKARNFMFGIIYLFNIGLIFIHSTNHIHRPSYTTSKFKIRKDRAETSYKYIHVIQNRV